MKPLTSSAVKVVRRKNSEQNSTKGKKKKKEILSSRMKSKAMLKELQADRLDWEIHSDTSTDHSSLLYFLLGMVPTPALTLALCLSLFHSLLPPLSFSSLMSTKHNVVASVHASLSLMLHLDLNYLHFTSDAQTQSLLQTLDYTAAAKNTNSHWPSSWKWFYSFNIISLNNDNTAKLPLANHMQNTVMGLQITVLMMGNTFTQINTNLYISYKILHF